MFYDADIYELDSEVELDTLLSDLPLNLLFENIIEQIDNPLSSSTNHLNIVLEKYNIVKTHFSDNEDKFNIFKERIYEFLGSVLNYMDSRLYLGLNEDAKDNLIQCVDAAYNYFILNYKNNMVKFFYKFIKENKKMLSETYEKMGKKKDVTTLNYKKMLKNKDDAMILSNLPNIISSIRGYDVYPEDFVAMTIDYDNIEGKYIQYLINRGLLTGNFVAPYINIVFDGDDTFLDELQIAIKTKIFKKSV